MSTQPEALIKRVDERDDDVLPLRPVTRPEEHPEVGDITYTRTRILAPRQDLLRQNRVVSALDHGPVADAYKIMCIQVLQRLRERNGNALAVVSPGNGEGKTLTAINLAVSLAREVDQTVLLVDADLRKPSVHRYFGYAPEAGLSDHLISGVPLENILINPGIERFVLLPGGRPLPNSVEMLGSVKMRRLVAELKQRYPSRIVIFDLPPVLSVADTLAFAPYVDAAMMVVQEHRTRREDIRRAAEMLKSVELIGTVMNQSMAPAAGKDSAERRPAWLARLFKRR
jgi:exopolysaccharide/PEP-CTERM locus tyrosine autokinase